MYSYIYNIFVGILLVAAVVLVIRKMIKDKRKGKSLQCGGDCSKCGMHCHERQDQNK